MDDVFSPVAGAGPLYAVLQGRIEAAIRDGRLKPGDSLPAEREIAARTGLSRVTVRRAIADLVRQGLLVQRRGSGTYVARPVERFEMGLSQLTSFSSDMARRGRDSSSQILSAATGPAAPEEMMALGLGAAEQVARIERVRWSGGMPMALERSVLSAEVLPDPSAMGGSLYAYLRARDLLPVRAVQRMSAVNLTAAEADLLQMAPGAAGLKIERVAYLSGGKAVEFTRSLFRGDAYDFAVELKAGDE